MDRRGFLKRASASAAALHVTSPGLRLTTPGLSGSVSAGGTPARDPDPKALVMDAMGELRPIYEPPLVKQMLAAGMDSITVTLCDPKAVGAEALELAVNGLLEYDHYLTENPNLFVKATSVEEVDLARRTGRMAVFYLFQNATQFEDDLARVDMFYSMGLTSCQVTYNDRNLAGVGCRAFGDEGGLTDFGRELVDRMNALGMLVDLSHANMPTMADTIRHSRSPVIISHTGAFGVKEHERNTTDENLRLLADNGGIVGMCQLRPFLTDLKTDNLFAYFDHIDHAVQVAGVEQVCIGSDRDHRVIEMTPEYEAELMAEEGSQLLSKDLPLYIDELNGPSRMDVVWDGLVDRGYSPSDVEKIMGKNLYRVYEEVIG